MIGLALACLPFALLPALVYFRNVQIFQKPISVRKHASISVLIPARNEEGSIRACVECVLKNEVVELECLVLDDHSNDRTAAIVNELAANNPRVRLIVGPPLPAGWSGKQHACFELSKQATKPLLTFLDADVRLATNALTSLAAFQESSGAALVSGFPGQETSTILEALLIPLIHWVLLGFLPLARMRASVNPAYGAGCGQWFLTTREAYDLVGGHAAVKGSFHDGVMLPRAYRRAGFRTDLCDATALASCRMYRGAGQVWNGLAKNAGEGLGSPRLILFWTAIFATQILPFALLATCIASEQWLAAILFAGLGLLILAPRIHAARSFRQSWGSVTLHPLGLALLIGIQWYALIRRATGRPVGWKGRTQPKGTQ